MTHTSWDPVRKTNSSWEVWLAGRGTAKRWDLLEVLRSLAAHPKGINRTSAPFLFSLLLFGQKSSFSLSCSCAIMCCLVIVPTEILTDIDPLKKSFIYAYVSDKSPYILSYWKEPEFLENGLFRLRQKIHKMILHVSSYQGCYKKPSEVNLKRLFQLIKDNSRTNKNNHCNRFTNIHYV